MHRAILFSLSFVAVSLTPSWGAFETLGQSSRASAMSDAVIAQGEGADVLWYNPAGLAGEGTRQVVVDYARLYPGLDVGPDINSWSLSYVQGLAGGDLGVGIAGLGAGFYTENALGIGYGRSMGEKLDVGLGVRMLRWAADGYRDPETGVQDEDGSGLKPGFDLGLRYDLLTIEEGMLVLGISGLHLNEPDTPCRLLLGVGYDHPLYLAEVDLELVDGDRRVRVGGEYKLGGHYDLRLRAGASGIAGDGAAGEVDGGIGFLMGSLMFNYSYHYSSEISTGANQRLSLGYQF